MIYESNSPEETKKIAGFVASKQESGGVVCLTGDLGGGKTVFAKGFANGLGITDLITSPTFTIMNAYEQANGLSFYHFDVYRLRSPEEMEDTGYEEYFYGSGVCLVEWAERIRDLIPPTALWIHIEKRLEMGQDYRMLSISGNQIGIYSAKDASL